MLAISEPCTFAKFKKDATFRIKTVAQQVNEELQSSKPGWSNYFTKIMEMVQSKNTELDHITNDVEPDRISTSYKCQKTASTSTSVRLSFDDKMNIDEIINLLDEDKMWFLSTGVCVEMKMKELATKSDYEHPCQSLILDPHDPTWLKYFSRKELEKIKALNCTGLPSIPDKLSEYLNSFTLKDAELLHEALFKVYYGPKSQQMLYWLKMPLIGSLDLFLAKGYLPLNDQSER